MNQRLKYGIATTVAAAGLGVGVSLGGSPASGATVTVCPPGTTPPSPYCTVTTTPGGGGGGGGTTTTDPGTTTTDPGTTTTTPTTTTTTTPTGTTTTTTPTGTTTTTTGTTTTGTTTTTTTTGTTTTGTTTTGTVTSQSDVIVPLATLLAQLQKTINDIIAEAHGNGALLRTLARGYFSGDAFFPEAGSFSFSIRTPYGNIPVVRATSKAKFKVVASGRRTSTVKSTKRVKVTLRPYGKKLLRKDRALKKSQRLTIVASFNPTRKGAKTVTSKKSFVLHK